MSLYEDLGIPPNATPEEIKAAHRRAVRQHHPDAGGSDEAFQRVQTAYGVLSDQSRRARYDRTGGTAQEDPVSVLRAKASAQVGMHLIRLAESPGFDPLRVNLVQLIKEALAEEQRIATENAEQGKAALARLAETARRLKLKADGDDPLGNALASRRTAIEGMLHNANEAMRLLAAAQDLVAEYVYRVDPAPPPPQGVQWVRMGSFGTSVG